MLCEGDNEKFPTSLEYPRCFFEQGLRVVGEVQYLVDGYGIKAVGSKPHLIHVFLADGQMCQSRSFYRISRNNHHFFGKIDSEAAVGQGTDEPQHAPRTRGNIQQMPHRMSRE